MKSKYASNFWILLAALFLFYVGTGKTSAAEFHLGSQYIYSQDSNFVNVPVFFHNFKNADVDKIRVSVVYNTIKAQLVDAALSSDLSGWSIDTQEPQADSTVLIVDGPAFSDSYKELFSMKFLVSMGADDYVKIKFREIAVNDQEVLDVTSDITRIVNSPLPQDKLGSGSAKGDYNNDSRIDYNDVKSSFGDLSDGLSSEMEFSGVKPRGSVYDVALLYQHATGLLPELPNPNGPLASEHDTSGAQWAIISVDGPNRIGTTDRYQYTFKGRNLEGLISVELDLLMNRDIIEFIVGRSMLTGETLNGGEETASSYRLFWASPQPVDRADLSWLTITVQNRILTGESGFTGFNNTVFNEGQIPFTIEGCMDETYVEHNPEAVVSMPGSCKTLKVEGCTFPWDVYYDSNANWHDERMCYGGAVNMSNPIAIPEKKLMVNYTQHFISIHNNDSHPVQFQLISVQGKNISSMNISSGALFEYSLEGIPRGTYIIRITGSRTNLKKIIAVNN